MVKKVNNILLLLVAVSVILMPKAFASSEEKAALKEYVEALIQQGYDIVTDQNLSLEQRKAKTAVLLRKNLYLDWMANATLGRHRRNLSKEQIEQFVHAYSDFIIDAYDELATSYNGEKAVLRSVKKVGDDLFIVHTEIIKPGSHHIKVDYLVHEVSDSPQAYKVGDIITEGISILHSQQSEFSSIITSRGIDTLIHDLKTRSIKSKPTPPQ